MLLLFAKKIVNINSHMMKLYLFLLYLSGFVISCFFRYFCVLYLLFLSFTILSQHSVAAMQQSCHNLIACSFTKLDNNELLVSLTLATAFCNVIDIHY